MRVIAASNGDLARAVIEGRFRRSGTARLNVASVSLPVLRERRARHRAACGAFPGEARRAAALAHRISDGRR